MNLDPTKRWPATLTSALCLTFDLDAETMWTSRDPANSSRPSVMSQGKYDVGEGLASVLDFLDANGMSATFFVPSDVARTHPEAVQRIVARGHEVGCHGTDHVPLKDASRADELQMLKRATEEIESITGVRPVGYRAPLYSVTDDSWGILRELGYSYSSNMMDTIHPYLHGDTGIAEMPVHWSLDDGPYFLMAFHPPNYRQPVPLSQVGESWIEELDAIAASGGLMTLTLHPQLIGRPSRLRMLQRVVDAARQIGGVWTPTMGSIAEHLSALPPISR